MSELPPPRRRLLLVEDDTMVRDTILLMLDDDYDLLNAGSASEALKIFADPLTGTIDIVLLDCLLPHGRVHDVLAAADRGSVPVVLISGDPMQASAVDPHRVFLPKPFSHTALLSVLDSARR